MEVNNNGQSELKQKAEELAKKMVHSMRNPTRKSHFTKSKSHFTKSMASMFKKSTNPFKMEALMDALAKRDNHPVRASPVRASPVRASPVRASPVRANKDVEELLSGFAKMGVKQGGTRRRCRH